MRLIILFLFFILIACSSVKDVVPQKEENLYKFQGDMIVTVDNVAFKAMAVTKLESTKQITIQSKARLDLLVISSCSRYEKFERINYKSGWFGLGGESAKALTYVYAPNEKEMEGTCPVFIQAYDMKGVTDWGYVTWRTDETLPATLSCNAKTTRFAGHSVCQAMAGTEQGIKFEVPVKSFEATETCKMVRDSDRTFSFRPQMGFCYATFFDGANWHRLTALGFERALVRGEP